MITILGISLVGRGEIDPLGRPVTVGIDPEPFDGDDELHAAALSPNARPQATTTNR
jgi:hypothetical protein